MSCGCSESNMSGGGKSKKREINLEKLSYCELKSLATKLKIEGRSKLTKKVDLISAIRKKNI